MKNLAVNRLINRREMLHRLTWAFPLLLLPVSLKAARSFNMDTSMQYRGVNYDTGTNFDPDNLSVQWTTADMQHDIRVIKEQLHCNTVNVFGTNITHLIATARFALQLGLKVWIQPRLFHKNQEEVLQHISTAATEAELLRQQYPQVILNTGCESSLFVSGIIPGQDLTARINQLLENWQQIPQFNKQLHTFLEKVNRLARNAFKGPLTYAAGPWEEVDWNLFDIIGLDYYRDASNNKDYVKNLKAFRKYGKPIVITEFGCCPYDGAEQLGAGGHDVIDWSTCPAYVKPGHTRSEKVQADYIADLFAIFRKEKVAGALVYVFHNPAMPHSKDPAHDLDMGSYSLVKTLQPVAGKTDTAIRWQPKTAFHTVAAMFRDIKD